MTRATAILIIALCIGAAGCSGERYDWRSAQSADSSESYEHFLQRHPNSVLAPQARARIEQLTEQRDWDRASGSDTVDAYKQFLTQHPKGKWSQEARIRVESVLLENQPPQPEGQSAQVIQRVAPAVNPAVTSNSASMAAVLGSSAMPSAVVGGAPVVNASAMTMPSASSGYGIQLGAFSSETKANDEWQRLSGQFNAELGDLSPYIVPALVADTRIFRLQALVSDEVSARSICTVLVEKSQGCVVVLPQH